jgi:hypothetical protein
MATAADVNLVKLAEASAHLEQWRVLASALPSVADVVLLGAWCFTPEMYVDRPKSVDTLAAFVRGRPAQPWTPFWPRSMRSSLTTRARRCARSRLPTLITQARDLLCSTQFAEPLEDASGQNMRKANVPAAYVTHYQISLDLSTEDFEGVQAGARLVFRWPDQDEPNTINLTLHPAAKLRISGPV